jgi:hypothetical protein
MQPNQTFKHLIDQGFRPFRHNWAIWAKPMDVPFTVDTPYGRQWGQPGDYWCIGVHQQQWVSPAAEFERSYIPV